MAEGFYLVWNPNRAMPKYKHPNEESAVLEAKRLSALHPGEDFVVLRSVGTAKKIEVSYNEHDWIPF